MCWLFKKKDKVTGRISLLQRSTCYGNNIQNTYCNGHKILQINKSVRIDNFKIEVPGGVTRIIVKESGKIYVNGKFIDIEKLKAETPKGSMATLDDHTLLKY